MPARREQLVTLVRCQPANGVVPTAKRSSRIGARLPVVVADQDLPVQRDGNPLTRMRLDVRLPIPLEQVVVTLADPLDQGSEFRSVVRHAFRDQPEPLAVELLPRDPALLALH